MVTIRRLYWALFALLLCLAGTGTALAIGETSGTVSVCASATVDAQTISDNGSPIATVPSKSSTSCATTTYTVPTVTATVAGATTTTPTTTTTPATTTTSSAPTWESETGYAAPAFTPTTVVKVATQSALASAWSNLQSGQEIDVAPMTLTGEVAFLNKQLSGWAEVHFAPGVKFVGVTTGAFPSVWINNVSHVRFYGGEVTNAASSASAGHGVTIYDSSDLAWWGFTIHDTAGDGFDVQGINKANSNLDIKGEIYDWGHNLSGDPHAEKGTGIHGANIADANYGVKNSRFALYVHDGPTGAGMEIGGASSTDGAWGNTIYMKCVNLTFRAVSQVAGNCLQVWGENVSSNTFPYIEATNLQGRPFDANGLYGGQSLSTDKVLYGRATNTNLNSSLSSTEPAIPSSTRWDPRGATSFVDVAPKP